MKDGADTKTGELIPLTRPRGRPATGEGKSAAVRKREQRARFKEKGLVPMTVNIPLDLFVQLTKFLQFKDTTKDEVVERFLRHALRKR